MSRKWRRKGLYFSRKRRRQPWLFLILAILLAITSTIFFMSGNRGSGESSQPKRAAILDGLSVDHLNRTFIKSAEDILRQAGFEVNIYGAENVSLKLLNSLPAKNYSLVVFRVHGGRIRQPAGLFLGGGLFIEKCGPESHLEEVETGYLLIGRPFLSNDTYCVAPPHYITDKLQGRFRSTVIIAMSCFTGNDNVLATAFFNRGAGAYIGFSGEISPEYADAFTITLLKKLYIENLPIQEAFNQAREDLGSDPHYGGTPTLYLP
ncbi:MAG: hypothetical protein QW692_06125 [Nitrososphaerota archaeon]